jgi:hypothetical protein
LLNRPAEPIGLNDWVFSKLNIDAARVGFEASLEFYANG